MRITHEPSGMMACADFGHSMFARKAACMSMLKGQLWSLERGSEDPKPTPVQLEIAERILKRRVASQ